MPTLNVYYIKANSKYSKDPNSSKKKNVKDYIRKLIIKEIFQTMFKICDSIEIKIEENSKLLIFSLFLLFIHLFFLFLY